MAVSVIEMIARRSKCIVQSTGIHTYFCRMQLLTGPDHDRCHMLNGEGAYEWWYTDALTADAEWGVVAILFRGMPMSPAYLSNPAAMAGGFAVSVYHRGTRIAFAFGDVPCDACDFATERVDVRVGDATMHIDHMGVMHVHIGRTGSTIERSVHVSITMDAAQTPSSSHGFDEDHGWVLARPRAEAGLRIELGEGSRSPSCVFEGRAMAYHDHNMGVRSMSADFGDWYWGRVHGPDRSFVYLTTPGSPIATAHAADITIEGNVLPWSHATFRTERYRINFMGLRMHRRIVIEGLDASGAQRRVECNNTVVCEDGPFYQRYISQWIDGGAEIGFGMSEYMDVKRLRAPWIRPFLRLPWTNVKQGVTA